MSERPKWMLEEVTVALLHLTSPEMRERLVMETGLRAQIAVLEEVSEHYGHTTRDIAQAKIAALRKELAK